MKKVVALLLALVLLCSVFAGCSQTQEPSDNQNNQPNTNDNNGDDNNNEAEPVTLKWVGAGYLANQKSETLINRFKDVMPNVTVEYTELNNLADDKFYQMYDTMIAGGEQVDMIYLGTTDILLRAINGAILPINDQIEKNGDDFVADYTEQPVSLYTIDGQTSGIPSTNNTFKVFYNKTLFEEKNLTIPEQWSFDEFTEFAKQVNDPANKLYGCVFPVNWEDLTYAPAEQAGWKMIVSDESGKAHPNFDDPIFRECMEKVAGLSLTENVSPSYAIIKAESLNRRVALANRQTAMIIDGPYSLVYLKEYQYNDPGIPFEDEIGVTELPYLNEDARDNASWVSPVGGFCLPKTCKNPDEAYAFGRFIANDNPDYMDAPPAYQKIDMQPVLDAYTTYTQKDGTVIKDIYDQNEVKKAITAPHESYLSYYNHDPKLYALYQPTLYKLFTEQYSTYFTGQSTLDDFINTMQTLGQTEIDNIDAAA